jgi:hypothetical protein
MDRADLISKGTDAIRRALRRPVILGLSDDDKRILRGIHDGMIAQPELVDPWLPYVNRPQAATPLGGEGAPAGAGWLAHAERLERLTAALANRPDAVAEILAGLEGDPPAGGE